MKRLLLPLILFILLAIEGVALDMLPASLIKSDLIFVPHWSFVFIILIAIFYDREDTYFSVFYALLFGLMTDVVYTGVLGVYMFSYAISAYMVHGLIKLLHANFVVTIILAMTGLLMAEALINVIFSVTSLADIGLWDYVVKRLLPTVGANMVFLLAAYPATVNMLRKWKKEHLSGKSGF